MNISRISNIKKIGQVSGIKHSSKVSFGAVSIESDSFSSQTRNDLIISDGDKKISELVNNGLPEKIEEIDADLQNLTDEMKIRRKIEETKPWYRRTKSALRKITKTESLKKNTKLQKKLEAVFEYSDRASKVREIADNVEIKVKENSIDPNYKRLKQSRELDDYKGTLAQTTGFAKIAGYDKEKIVLDKYFISEIRKEKNGEQANVPNAVLFFGPTGNGKTTFAKAFANETGCRFVHIRADFSSKGLSTAEVDSLFLETIMSRAKNSEELYKQKGIRSIIFVDEITKVADKNSSILSELTELFLNCSKKYHCTIFCASNHPLNIGLPMEGKNSVFPYIVSMDPPDLKNKEKILQYYLKGRVDNDIDYSKIAEYMNKNEIEKNGIFNISQIKDEICLDGLDAKITEDEILHNIERAIPNISGEDLDKYSDEMDKLIKNEVSE